MDDRLHLSPRLVALLTVALEAVIIGHAVGIVSFGGPELTLGLFVVVAALFWYIHRDAQANFAPPSEYTPVQIPPRLARALLLLAIALGFVASLLAPRLAQMGAGSDTDLVQLSAVMTVACAIAAATVLLAFRRHTR